MTVILKDIDPQDAEEIRKLREEHDRIRQDGIIRLRYDLEMPLAHLTVRSYRGQDGKDMTHQYRDRAKSWVRNMYNWGVTEACGAVQSMFDDASGAGAVYGAGSARYRNTGGSILTSTLGTHITTGARTANLWLGTANSNTRGIIVGTGTAAETMDGDPTGYRLQTAIDSGNGAGELYYQAHDPQVVESWDAGTRRLTMRHRRLFNNNSGGQIDVSEVGIYVLLYYSTASTDCMICRDLLGAAVPVYDGGQLEVIYDIESYALPA